MRMWMVDPHILCDKHLRGEYVECLMFVGTFKRKMNIPGYVNNNLVEPLSIIERFDILKSEMIRREFDAQKELDFDICTLDYLKKEWLYHKVNILNALDDLIRRCPICALRYQYKIEDDIITKRDKDITSSTYSRNEWQSRIN